MENRDVGQLAFLVSALRRDFCDYCNAELKRIGLSQGMLYFVLYVGKHPGCTQKSIVEALHMDVGHTTRSVGKLVAAGLMEQRKNPEDGRSNVLTLTEAGEHAFQVGHELVASWNGTALQGLAADEVKTLERLLERVVASCGIPQDYLDLTEG